MAKFFVISIILLISSTLSAKIHVLPDYSSYHFSKIDSAKISYTPAIRTNSLLKTAIFPLSLITAGIIIEALPANVSFSKVILQKNLQNKMDGFRTSADNYLQFTPIAALFGFKLLGMKSRSDLMNQAIITVKTEFLVSTIVFSMKYFIHDMRPDGSSDNTMPSGHTAQAFASATLLDMEYRDTSPWISAGGYLCAAATGFFRVANNRHWTSDVLIGAGIGIASVKLVYFTHRYKWGKMPMGGILIPSIYPGGGGLSFSMKF
jgi:membrane-associated phospholipid phosphatase